MRLYRRSGTSATVGRKQIGWTAFAVDVDQDVVTQYATF